MASLSVQTLEPAAAGLDTDNNAGALAKGYAPVHENMLVDHDRITPMRGPITNQTELVVGADEIVAGIWEFNNSILVARHEKDATAVREPWAAPHRKATAANQLANPQLEMQLFDFDALTSTPVTAVNAAGVISGGSARIGDYVYGFAYGVHVATNPAVLENGGYLYRRRLLRWDGTSTPPTVYANAPEGAQDVKAHLNRLFVLGGRDVPAGGTEIEPNSLFYTDAGGPTADTTAMWQDDVSGLTNKIVVDSDDRNDHGVGLAKVGQNLVIFKRNSIHVLYGYSSSTFTLRPLTKELGCIDRRSIVEYEDGCYFLSDEGYMFFDGTTLRSTSPSLYTSLVAAGYNTVGANGVDGGTATAVKLPNNYLLLSIFKQNQVTGVQSAESRFSALLHAPTGRWTRFSSEATSNPTPVALARAAHPIMFDGTRVIQIPYLTAPGTAPEASRGFDEITDTGVSVKARIPAKIWYRLLELVSPAYHAQLHRLLIDYSFVVNGAADNAVDGWYVTAVQGDGQDLVEAEFQLPSQGEAGAYAYRRRHVVDSFREASDLQLRVEWRPDDPETFPALIRADIQDVTVEFSVARQRRSG